MALPSPLQFSRTQVVNEHIFVVTLNRPDRLNALHNEAAYELAKVWDHYETNPALWVAILTGAGDKAFSAGFGTGAAEGDGTADLKSAMGGSVTDKGPPTGFGGLVQRRTNFKPIIAAVNGIAFGGGFEMALACDIILASDQARFGLPEPKRGLAALAGGLTRLPRVIGIHRAMGLILTGREVGAAEGERLGFVTEVVAHDRLQARALELANAVLECSPDSIRASKQVVLESLATPNVIDAIERQSSMSEVRRLFKGENLPEGIIAFNQKRKPVWTSKL